MSTATARSGGQYEALGPVVNAGTYLALRRARVCVIDRDAGPELIAYELGATGTRNELAGAAGDRRAAFDTGAGVLELAPADLLRRPE